MEQSPSCEANRFSASQEIPRTLWKPNVHYRIHKCPPPLTILSHLDPVYAQTFHFLKIYLTIMYPFTPGSFQWPLSFRFHTETLYTPLLSPTRTTCPSHLILLCFIIRNIFGEQYRSLRSSLCSFFHFHATSSLLRPNIVLIVQIYFILEKISYVCAKRGTKQAVYLTVKLRGVSVTSVAGETR
jgi:hypothetical protein